jgi:DNA polymerase I-like protein with 3'-5' exonuclease and polymerase domains
MTHINTVLVDRRSGARLLPGIIAELESARLVGFDLETQDEARHEGLNVYNNATRHVFDHRRTTITGFSTYVEGSDTAYYYNLAHADVENRLPQAIGAELLAKISDKAIKVAHNAPFELVNVRQCWGVDISNLVCTLQMAVSHHGPDQYDIGTFFATPLPKAFHKIAAEVIEKWAGMEPGDRPTGVQQELLGKFIAKESKAEHSYNGFVKGISMGYSLKALTKSAFGYEQATFKDTLAAAGARHMGELTGEQTVAYGADDAYWAVRHYRRMFDDMLKNNPKALKAFFTQENPMVQVYADSWREGIRLDLDQVFERRNVERADMAELLRAFKARIRQALPFVAEPHHDLKRKEKWYYDPAKEGTAKVQGYISKRKQIEAWANSPDDADDFKQIFQVSNPIGNAWAEEKGIKVPGSGKLNIVYYHAMRTIMYDLIGAPMQYAEGSVASDKEARGRIREELDPDGLPAQIMRDLQSMADIEQRMKLYLTPYTQLMDPETSRVYPSLSSRLATRRLATSFPNPMQLAKSGDSAYIRSFYLGDDDDHVVISADWSAIELVLIGDMAGGQGGMKEVYGQLPYGDMHTGAAVDALSIKTLPGLTEEEFREFKFNRNPEGRVLRDFSGRDLSPKDYHKFMRGTPVGKGINFGYWYSGACSTVANNLGLSDEQHWELVDMYRSRFPEEERWRVSVQDEASMNGFIVLPDGHQRNRFECLPDWRRGMLAKFADLSASPGLVAYAETACKRLQARARNQVVNAMIQGTCATLAKRSILNLRKLCEAAGLEWGVDCRLMMPIHDELVWSVRRAAVMTFIPLLRQAMAEHPEIVKHFPLNCTVAMGRTFRPFDKSNPFMSQIELDEAQVIDGVIDKELEGTVLNDHKVEELLDRMFA